MCGIAGILTSEPLRGDELTQAVNRMRDAIAQRGPDDAGTRTTECGGVAVALGFRRLSIPSTCRSWGISR
jgi:asparagine synthetase B (glutamine-hydrolysing)